jgi:hypothetical protein
MTKTEQYVSRSIEYKNNKNDKSSQIKAQSLLHTLYHGVTQDKARIEESIKQNNLHAENAKSDSLTEKIPLMKSHGEWLSEQHHNLKENRH